jgi:cytidyltransferase-like protein
MTLVLCNGVFDLFHIGHLRHLEEALSYGTHLVVSVTMDEHVNKGPGKPIEPLEDRMAKLRALRIVSAVTPCKDGLQALEHWRPSVFCKGSDYQFKGVRLDELRFCRKNDIRIVYTQAEKFSTGEIIRRIKQCA